MEMDANTYVKTYEKICEKVRKYVDIYENIWKYPEIDFLENQFSGKLKNILKYAGFW